MAAKKSAKKAPSNRKGNAAAGGSSDGWTEAERAAMKERAREMKRASRSRGGGESEEGEVLAKIAAMSGSDRVLGERTVGVVKDERGAPQFCKHVAGIDLDLLFRQPPNDVDRCDTPEWRLARHSSIRRSKSPWSGGSGGIDQVSVAGSNAHSASPRRT